MEGRRPGAPPAATARASRVPVASSRASMPPTRFEDITTYNNFYEFGTRQGRPGARTRRPCARGRGRCASRARSSKPRADRHRRRCCSWFPLEERVYRMRCVEAWSMVIPWLGFPLGELIAAARADLAARSTSSSRRCSTREQMPGQTRRRPATGRTSRGCASTRRCTR